MLAQKSLQLQKPGVSTRRVAPFQSTRRPVALPRAASSTKPAVLVWTPDTETFKDVMSFGGSAPERVNGRVAMISFVSVALAEASTHTPLLEQFPSHVFQIVLINFLITMGSLAPKFLTGTPLSVLHAAATPENLDGTEGPAAMLVRVIDQNIELWTGRVAMLGLAGLAAVEFGLGRAFF